MLCPKLDLWLAPAAAMSPNCKCTRPSLPSTPAWAGRRAARPLSSWTARCTSLAWVASITARSMTASSLAFHCASVTPSAPPPAAHTRCGGAQTQESERRPRTTKRDIFRTGGKLRCEHECGRHGETAQVVERDWPDSFCSCAPSATCCWQWLASSRSASTLSTRRATLTRLGSSALSTLHRPATTSQTQAAVSGQVAWAAGCPTALTAVRTA